MSRPCVISLVLDVDGSSSFMPGYIACKLALNGGVQDMMILKSADGVTPSIGVSKTPPGGKENHKFQGWVGKCTYLAYQLHVHAVQITGKVVLNILNHEGSLFHIVSTSH